MLRAIGRRAAGLLRLAAATEAPVVVRLAARGLASHAAPAVRFRPSLVLSPSAWAPASRLFSAGPGSMVVIPSMGDSISEGTIATVLKKPGDAVAMDEIVAQIETDKVTIDVKAPTGGAIGVVLVNVGDVVKPGQSAFTVLEGAAGNAAPAKAAPAAAAPAAKAAPAKAAVAAPAAVAPKPHTPSVSAPVAAPKIDPSVLEHRVPMTRLRMRVAERLKASQNTYAMLSTFNEVDMSNLMQLREEYKDLFTKTHGVKLGFMSAFCKAASYALQKIPAVNGVIDGTDIVYRDYVDISVAVGSPKGLVVPVIRGVHAMTYADIEKTIGVLGERARDGSLSMNDMAGGTFTISNGGVYGSLLSTPIINPPQSAILGMHSIVKRPVCVGDAIVARPMMYIALTYDHRLIDGREAVTFLKHIKEVVEDPRRMLLDI